MQFRLILFTLCIVTMVVLMLLPTTSHVADEMTQIPVVTTSSATATVNLRVDVYASLEDAYAVASQLRDDGDESSHILIVEQRTVVPIWITDIKPSPLVPSLLPTATVAASILEMEMSEGIGRWRIVNTPFPGLRIFCTWRRSLPFGKYIVCQRENP